MAERGRGERSRGGGATTWPPRSGASSSGTIPSYSGLGESLADRLRAWVHAEAGAGRLFPWLPIAFGAGIALYFTAEREPVAWVAASAAALLGVAALALRRHPSFAVMLMLAALVAGFAVASLKTARVSHAVLSRPAYVPLVKGYVEVREERERTDRFVLRVVEMDPIRGQSALSRVRLSVAKGTAPKVGEFVSLKARLLPPLQPQRPGSYDFARDMYFQGIGASGFALGAIAVTMPPEAAKGDWALRYAGAMQGLRDAIDNRIRGVLSGDVRAIATALLTGKRDAITSDVNDAMFISGLGHVLSISGYHMAVVAGLVFFAVRALLALIPALTVTFPIKKAAAMAALVAAAFYLMLSGAEVATQRSFVMTAVVLIAVMVDRRAVTFRTLAIAAMIVLVLTPEAVVHPSFQMSFAATLGLVALVQVGMPRLFATPDSTWSTRIALWGGREAMMLALASFVAGLATTPYAAFHFHRITPYGVLANLAAMPVVSVLVMPAGILGLIAAPFGFDGVFWRLMEVGIVWMIAVSQWVAALPGAIGRIGAFGTGPLITASAGIILMGLLRSPLRWGGAGVLAVSVAWALLTPQPDILVSGDGHSVGVRGRDGRLHVMRTAKDAFLLREWLAADADGRAVSDASLAQGVSCDPDGCIAPLPDGRLVTMALRPEAFADDCAHAAVMVTTRQSPADCVALVLGAEQLRRQGALALRRTRDGFRIDAVRPDGVDRPWAPAVAATGEVASPSSARPKPVDATLSESDVQADD